MIRLDPPQGPPGFVTAAVGSGFPAGQTVTLRWDRGIRPPVAATADAAGAFRVQVLVFHKDLTGRRRLVPDPPFAEVAADFVVDTAAAQPPTILGAPPHVFPIVGRR